MATNYKTYMLIDFNNNIYGFVNDASDIKNFYANRVPAIPITSLAKDPVTKILTGVILVNVKTKEEVHIKFSSGSTLCIN